jgi:hypothetical protein
MEKPQNSTRASLVAKPLGKFRYRLNSTGASSAKYGVCEVCGEHASEVFIQSETQLFDLHGAIRETHFGCRTLFGHKACLEGEQRKAAA